MFFRKDTLDTVLEIDIAKVLNKINSSERQQASKMYLQSANVRPQPESRYGHLDPDSNFSIRLWC